VQVILAVQVMLCSAHTVIERETRSEVVRVRCGKALGTTELVDIVAGWFAEESAANDSIRLID